MAARPGTTSELWKKYLDFCSRKRASNYVFRGHASRDFTLRPKVGRSRVGGKSHTERDERAVFAKFKRQLPQFGFAAVADDWSLLALAQHHGLPTRLLDWTSNPLVAAYFSVTTSPTETDAMVIAYRTSASDYQTEFEIPPFDATEVRFFVPASVAPRIVNQKGLFSLHPNPAEAWEAPLADPSNVFVVPSAVKNQFRRRLFSFGVDPLLIETGLDGLCHTLSWQYDAQVGLWLDV